MKKSILTLLFILAIAIYTPLTMLFLLIHAFSIPFGSSVIEGEVFKKFTSVSTKVISTLQSKIL